MKPIKLEMTAFGSYKEKTVIDFRELGDCSLFLIDGDTGAGKTTIFDAMCYALYGVSSGTDKKVGDSSMKCQLADGSESMVVDYTFELGEKRYRVRREQRYTKTGNASTKNAHLWNVTGQEESLLSGPNLTEVNAAVEKLMGIGKEQFRQVILIPQGEYRRMLLANSRDRGEILRVLFNTYKERQLSDALKEKADKLKQESENEQQKRETLLESVHAADVDELKKRIEDGEALAASQAKACDELKISQDKANAEKNAADQLEKLFADSEKKAEIEHMLSGKLKEMEKRKEALARADEAARLEDSAYQRKTARDESKQKNEALINAREAAAAAKKEAEETNAIYQKQLAAKPEIEKDKIRLGKLDELRKKEEMLRPLIEGREAMEKELKKAVEAEKNAEAAALNKKNEKKRSMPVYEQIKTDVQLFDAANQRVKLLMGFIETSQSLDKANKKLEATKKAFDIADAAAKKAKEEQRAIEERLAYERSAFTAAQAYIMAEKLDDGKPCPVCGSTEHPHIAVMPDKMEKISDDIIEEDDSRLEAAKKRTENAEKTLNQAGQDKKSAEKEVELLQSQLESAPEKLDEELKNEQKKLAVATKAKKRLPEAEAWSKAIDPAIERAEAAYKEASKRRQEKDKELNNLLGRIEAGGEQYKGFPLYKAIDMINTDYYDLSHLIEANEKELNRAEVNKTNAKKILAKMNESLAAATEGANAAERAKKAAEKSFAEKLEAAGFIDEATWSEALSGELGVEEGRKAEHDRLDEFHNKMLRAEQDARTAAAKIEGKKRPDTASALAAYEKAQGAYKKAVENATAQKKDLDNYRDTLRAIEKSEKESAESERYARAVIDIARLASKGGGEDKVNFETFVLGAMLEDVMDAANRRLLVMSSRQYSLERGDHKGNGLGGLEMQILDHQTGMARELSTLSGGESFLASLSMALGLADVVQSYAGGVHLDTIFIDEGFGSLDDRTLDTVLKAFAELRKHDGRLVGIISHVDELREAIDTRLEVTKDPHTGSHAQFVH